MPCLLRHVSTLVTPLLRSLLLGLACLPTLIQAAPEPHGKKFLALEDAVETPGSVAASVAAAASASVPSGTDGEGAIGPSPVPAEEAIGQLRSRLEAQRLMSGPYGPAAAETLIDLARLLEARGDTSEVVALREEALHLIRVNEGLYSAAQGPVLRAMLDSLRRAGDFQALDDRYAYYFRLYGAGRRPFNERRWAATMEYLDWQREALRRELDADPRQRLLDLHAMQAELLVTLAEAPASDWRWLRDLTRSQLATLYLIEDSVEPQLQMLRRSQVTRVRGDELRDVDLLRERLENLQRTARARGRALIEAALARVPAAEVAARAELNLDLADWLLWHGSSRSAHEVYARVWRELEDAGRGDLRRAWLEQPLPLPRGDVFAPLDRARTAALTVLIDVSAYGRVRVSSEGVPETREREFSILRRLLRASRFRPAFRDGEPIDSGGLATSWLLIED